MAAPPIAPRLSRQLQSREEGGELARGPADLHGEPRLWILTVLVALAFGGAHCETRRNDAYKPRDDKDLGRHVGVAGHADQPGGKTWAAAHHRANAMAKGDARMTHFGGIVE